MTSVREQSGYFQAGDQRLYGTLYAPDVAVPHAGVLFLPPFGEEWKCAVRHLVRTARGLAANGYGAFRFDPSGTGESTGRHASASLAGWQQEAAAALAVMAQAFPATRARALLGARLGANLAVRVAGERQIPTLMLFEPLLTGQDYLRDLLRRQMIKSVIGGAAPAVSAGPADDAWSDGQPLDLGGFEVGPVLAGELTQMRLVEDLWRLDPQSSLQLLRYSGGREFPPAWRPVLDQARGVARRDVRVVQEKPFWGQLEYYETDSLLENALRFLSADGNRPDTVSTGTDAAASPVLKPQ